MDYIGQKTLPCDLCGKLHNYTGHSTNKYQVLQGFQWSVRGFKTDNRLGIYIKCVGNCIKL